ncbi:MAG: hypothetical protein AB3N16_08490 [Flavobacteriaceae bacterium]
MAIPNNGTHNTAEEQIGYSDTEAWTFPKGAVLIKQINLGGKRLETRFIVMGNDGNYYYLSYKWNNAQTDAELFTETMYEDVQVDNETVTWQYPSTAE